MNRQKGRTGTQVSVDEDQNLPQEKADIERVIQEKSEIRMEEVRAAAGQVLVRGLLVYHILYMDNEEDHGMHSLRGKIPFEESIVMEDVSDKDHVCISWDFTQPVVSLINSRKINYRTVVTLTVTVEEVYDEEVTVDIYQGNNLYSLPREMNVLQMKVNKRDIFRIRQQTELPADRPNVEEVLFYTVTPKNVELRCLDNEVAVSGELDVFLLYAGEDRKGSQWLDWTLPFQGTVPCSGSQPELVGDLYWEMGSRDLEIRPDGDGENRIVSVDGIMELSMKVYEEEQISCIQDAYATDRKVIPQVEMVPFQRLVLHNNSQCRTSKRMKVADASSRVMQICHTDGSVKLDSVRMVDGGLQADGTVELALMYITADDIQPYRLARGSMQFSHVIEVPGITETCTYRVYPSLDQLTASMLDSEEMEVSAVMSMDAMILESQPESVLTGLEEQPLDYEQLEEMPALVGYKARPGDTLWNIARTYFTTVDALKDMNGLTGDELTPGQQLVIMKQVS